MTKLLIPSIILFLFFLSGNNSIAQKLQLGEVIITSNSVLKKNVNPEAFEKFFIDEVAPEWSKVIPGSLLYLLQADRGDKNGEYLLTCIMNNVTNQDKALSIQSPFTDLSFSQIKSLTNRPSSYLINLEKYTEYMLIGADELDPLPIADILGFHYIQVREDRTEAFEEFVKEKLNPSLSQLLPDMGLFYYKAVAGENIGSYITIFAITSTEAREKYWPTGAPETIAVKEAFGPMKDLADELVTYLVEGSYLLPESGAAAYYFESLKWTDFVFVTE